MSLYAFHLGQIISTVLVQVNHGGQDGNAARTRIETSETDHTQKQHFCHGAICRTIIGLAILRCLYCSEMVLLGVVIGKCETPTINISQENGHDILMISGVASSINEGDIFIYSCSPQLISFEIKSISKEVNCAEHKYMNMSPSLIELATPLLIITCQFVAYNYRQNKWTYFSFFPKSFW